MRNLKIGYGEKVILQNINFQVRQRRSVRDFGGSGSGKSTLLKNLIGLYSPMEGEIWIEGCNLIAAHEDQRLASVPQVRGHYQSGALFGSMTVLENVRLPLDELTALPGPIKEIGRAGEVEVGRTGAAAQKCPPN